MSSVLVIAPHPDDETLGCGGTMLRARARGDEVNWLIVTAVTEAAGFSVEQVVTRRQEIAAVANALDVTRTIELEHATAALDQLPLGQLISEIGAVVSNVEATDIYLPFRRDAHSDHAIVFDAGAACSKWFRYPSVSRVLAYETPSETDFDIAPDSTGFRPNVFVDVTPWLDEKLCAAQIFESEFKAHPFPRSVESMRALATLRGAASGFHAAEAFMLLRERQVLNEVTA